MANIKDFFKNNFDKHGEENFVRKYLKLILKNRQKTLLDVGCGKGKYLKLASEMGFDVEGIDANQSMVNENKAAGFICYHISEINTVKSKSYDVILISHVIEHLAPDQLLDFLNTYLPCLKKNGYLIICTPLMSEHFYNDFDHIKPYQPYGLITILGDDSTQVQYHAKDKLSIMDLNYRVYPYRLTHVRGLYVKSWTTPFILFFNYVMAFVCICSFRKIAKKDGWVALFKKS